jgi:hypothetical protein
MTTSPVAGQNCLPTLSLTLLESPPPLACLHCAATQATVRRDRQILYARLGYPLRFVWDLRIRTEKRQILSEVRRSDRFRCASSVFGACSKRNGNPWVVSQKRVDAKIYGFLTL